MELGSCRLCNLFTVDLDQPRVGKRRVLKWNFIRDIGSRIGVNKKERREATIPSEKNVKG